ncbi:MAG: hypothetical protein P0S96_06555 [Simkaniaceae bacterium]|nr:hypothetical protein [Candidatus Sacchlamyda saccharinae]
MKRVLILFVFFAIPVYAKIVLDDAMSNSQKEQTGVSKLNYSQKMALQEWINSNFDTKEGRPEKPNEQLYLSLNIAEGSRLELSDGKTYEIDPEDRIYTSFWITPIPLMVGKSGDPGYPVKITNLNTGTSVNGKQVSTRKIIEESERLDKQVPRSSKPEIEKAPKKPKTK